MTNKYGARRTYSFMLGWEFASKKEAARAEELFLLGRAGEVTNIEYQPRYILSQKPRVTYTADFRYTDSLGIPHVEDVKGVMTEATRVRIAWLQQLTGIIVEVI